MLTFLEAFPTICCDPHSQRLWHSQESRNRFFLELSWFFDDPADVGNLISGSSAFSKKQLEHLEVHGSHIAEAWLGEF